MLLPQVWLIDKKCLKYTDAQKRKGFLVANLGNRLETECKTRARGLKFYSVRLTGNAYPFLREAILYCQPS